MHFNSSGAYLVLKYLHSHFYMQDKNYDDNWSNRYIARLMKFSVKEPLSNCFYWVTGSRLKLCVYDPHCWHLFLLLPLWSPGWDGTPPWRTVITKLDIAFAKCQRTTIQNKHTNWKLKKTVIFCARHFLCSQAFKTTSNVLNSDVNFALIAFCSLAVTNLAHWATSSLRQWNAIYQNPEKAKTNDNCVTNYRPASNPHERKGSEIRYKILRFAQHCFVASFESMFRVFHLSWSTCRATKMFVDPLMKPVEGSCCKK